MALDVGVARSAIADRLGVPLGLDVEACAEVRQRGGLGTDAEPHLGRHRRASWLNQIAIYFSNVQRKVLEPNDCPDLATVARTLNASERHWSEVAEPFDWQFTRDDLATLMERLSVHEPQLRLAA